MSDENQQLEPHLQAGPPNITWDDIQSKRFAEMLRIDSKYNFDSPEEMIADYQAYKEVLRNIISNAKAAGKEPWEVAASWPDSPDPKWQPGLGAPKK